VKHCVENLRVPLGARNVQESCGSDVLLEGPGLWSLKVSGEWRSRKEEGLIAAKQGNVRFSLIFNPSPAGQASKVIATFIGLRGGVDPV